MKLSVVIPCKNEAGIMEGLLDSLAIQTTLADEVIVINSHSSDATAEIAKSYKNRLPLKVVKARKKGPASARNEGAATAKGELFLFIDADVVLPSQFIGRFLEQVNARSLQVGGFSQRMISNKVGLRLGARCMNGYVKLMSITPWPIFFSCFFATKKVHERLNGFDEKTWIMEDYDYAYRARQSRATFGIIHGTYFKASARRFQEHVASGIFKAIYAEMYRYTHGMHSITKPLFHFETGGKQKEKQKSQLTHK